MKNKLTLILLSCCFLIFYSCETEGQITGAIIEPPQDVYVDSDLNPEGGDDAGHIGDLYYNLLSNENYNQEFWKFNYFHLNGGNHCGPNSTGCELDVLDLVTFNDSYYIPPEAFTGSGFCNDPEFNNDEGGCCLSGGGNWTGSECDPVGANDWTPTVVAYIVNPVYDSSDPNSEQYIPYIGEDGFNVLEELVTEELIEIELVTLSEEMALTTPSLSIPTDPIEKIKWSLGENMYTFTIMSPIKDTIFFPYEYEYNLRHNFVALDTILNPILDDVTVILDPDETGDELRYYDIFDTLDVEANNSILPVNIYREHTFYSYMNQLNNDFTQRINTDCNDNYQKDDAELTIDDFESDCNANWIQNENDLCNSFCSTNGITMYDLCWNEFLDEERLTGHCFLDNSIGAFCDTGNNLYDNHGEVLHDACFGDCDGENGDIDVIGQGVEPFEDRNCNNAFDNAEAVFVSAQNEDDCLDAMSDFENFYTSWDSNLELCYIDAGNGQWDDSELCYLETETCNYMNLYEKGFSPNVLIADYTDQINPSALTNIFGGDVYLDCGSDQLCNEDEFGYNPGTCDDNYSGTEETCCKHNLCWDYSGEGQCDYNLDECMLSPSGGWQENLDPNGDDVTTERNFQYDPGELLVKDFNDDLSYSIATSFETKYLHYQSCEALGDPTIDDNCGGNLFEVISDEIEVASTSDNIQKYDAEVDVSSYKIIGQLPISDTQINDLNIVKTQWPDADEIDGQSEDYMLFMNSNDYDSNGMHYIIKLIQPYFYFAWSVYTGTGDMNEYDEDLWWQSLSWDKDTLLYSDNVLNNGRIIDGASWHTVYDAPSDTAQYVIHKEYEVSHANAEMTYSPTVENCVLITRTITTTMVGPAVDFKLRSQTYLKEGFPVVKEVISWSWPPNLGGTENIFFDIASMEYKSDVEQNYSNNMFDNAEPIELQNIQNYEGFNFDPFILSNTIGLQRFIMPPEPGLDQ